MNHIFDINLGIWIMLGSILLVAIISTLINHRKKTKFNKIMCIKCNGMGFRKPIPVKKYLHIANAMVLDIWIRIKFL